LPVPSSSDTEKPKPRKFTFQFAPMHHPHKNPNHIFTTQLPISHIFISHETSDVSLLGCYADIPDPVGMRPIAIETDFTTLNELLTDYGPEAEDTIDQLSKLLSQPSDEDPMIDLTDEGGLYFSDDIFSFMVILDTDEQGNIQEPEEYNYRLLAYTPRENIIPDFTEFDPPQTHQERSAYLNSLLAMQYHVYLSCRKKLDDRTALIYSNLTNPICFNLAKTMYELQIKEQTN
jgi:hypothetical protein